MTSAEKGSADCAMYLKEGETPRQRMDRFHTEALGLMRELERVTRNRDMWKGQVARQAPALTIFREALTDIAVYGCGMLNQPAAMNGPSELWLERRIREYERRAAEALKAP